MSGREIASLTLDRLADLPGPCARCVFWELDPALEAAAVDSGSPELDKEAWLSSVLLQWGSVGRIAYVDGRPAGYVTYAPAYLVPRGGAFPTSPVSADAVLLMAARVDDEFAGQGLGRVLVQTAAKDVMRRGIRAIEAFGYAGPPSTGSTDPGRSGAARLLGPRRQEGCIVPAGFLSAVGFKTVRPHRTHPRMRLDLRSVVTWREEMEQAVERLLSSVRAPALPQGRRA